MPREIKSLKEKRKHARYRTKLAAHLKVSFSSHDSGKILKGIENIIALAETNNISIGGMSMRIVGTAMEAKKSLTHANAVHLVGRPVEVTINKGKLAIWGDVIRTDVNTLELAIVIYKVSDAEQWKKICLMCNERTGIFPDEFPIS